MKYLTEGVIVAIVTGIFGVITLIIQSKVNKKNDSGSDVELSYHPFFVRSEMLKTHIETTFCLENKGKEAVFKDILYNQITAFQNVLMELAKKVDKGDLNDSNHLYNSHMEALEEIIDKHMNFYKNNPVYSLEEQGVFDIVMKKYAIWNKGKIQRLQENILTICNSPFYPSQKIQAAVILDLYLGVLVDTVNDASNSLNTINGDLRGLKFRNIII
jgi:hypothetical protein